MSVITTSAEGPSSGRVEVGGEIFEVTRDRRAILEVLVSALEDARDRNAELENNRAELAEANARRDEVLNVVSHELRGPLGVLAMAADVFNSDARTGATVENQRKFAERVVRQVQRMVTIVDDLLDATRIDAGELRVEPTHGDLVTVVRDAVERIRPTSTKHTIEVTAPPSIRASIDVDRIEQVIANFLTNAIKYSPRGGRIAVTVAVEGARVRVAVTDSGIGIDPSALPRMFERYYRVPGSERTAKGIGLGLFVTKQLVEAHGGSVHVESTPGRGSTFSFLLPL